MVINMIKHCWNSDTHFCVLLTTCQHLIDLIFQRALRQIKPPFSLYIFVSAFWFYRLAETKINFVYDNNPNQAFKLLGLTTIYYGYKLLSNFRHLLKQILTRHYTKHWQLQSKQRRSSSLQNSHYLQQTPTGARFNAQLHMWLTPMHVCLVLTRHFTAADAAWIRFGKFIVIRVKITKNLHAWIDPHLAQVSNRIIT